jgi:hypothetical protein
MRSFYIRRVATKDDRRDISTGNIRRNGSISSPSYNGIRFEIFQTLLRDRRYNDSAYDLRQEMDEVHTVVFPTYHTCVTSCNDCNDLQYLSFYNYVFY